MDEEKVKKEGGKKYLYGLSHMSSLILRTSNYRGTCIPLL